MTRLHRLHDEQDQSPWLDNLTRDGNADAAAAILSRATELGVDLAGVGRALEVQGVAAFARSFTEVPGRLQAKVAANA